jgi:hypothetical protein
MQPEADALEDMTSAAPSAADLEDQPAPTRPQASRADARRAQDDPAYAKAAAELRAQIQTQSVAATPAPAEVKMHLWLWVAAILTFGFGDTFTSMMTFNAGGVEANPAMSAVLNLMGGSMMAFVLVKMVATVGVLLLSRLHPRMDAIAATAMLATGVFLVGFNASQLL